MTHTLFFTNIPPMGWLIIAVVILVLFGRGKISALMGEVGKGITSFKRGVREGTEEIEQEIKEVKPDIPEAETVEKKPAKKPAKKSSKKPATKKTSRGKDKS